MLNYTSVCFISCNFVRSLPNSLLGRKWWWQHIPLQRWWTAGRAPKSAPKCVYDHEFECRLKAMSDSKQKNKVWSFVKKRKHEEIKITGNSCHKSLHEFDTIIFMYESDGWRDMRWGYVMFVRPDVAWFWCPIICWLVSKSMYTFNKKTNISNSGWIWRNLTICQLHLYGVLYISLQIYHSRGEKGDDRILWLLLCTLILHSLYPCFSVRW